MSAPLLFDFLVNTCCCDLPEGWNVEINLEKGAGWIVVYHNGEVVEFPLDRCDPLSKQLTDCLNFIALPEWKEQTT